MKKYRFVILILLFIFIYMCNINVGYAGRFKNYIESLPDDIKNEINKKCNDLGDGESETCSEFIFVIYMNYKNNFFNIMNKCNYGYSDNLKSCIYAETAKVDQSSIDEKKCTAITEKALCNTNCAWNDTYNFCSPNGLTYLKCGDSYDIPEMVPKLTSYGVTLLKTVAPIVLIVMSIVQLVKAISSSKEDELKKVSGSLFKKVISAAIIFLSITIVQFVMFKVTSSNEEKSNLSSCLSCFLNGTSKCDNLYYKDGYGKCFYISGESFDCYDSVK